MKRRRRIAIVAALMLIAACVCLFLWRDSLKERWHRFRLAQEIHAWQNPPVTETPDGLQIRDYRDYSGVTEQLERLVEMDAIERIEVKMQLYDENTMAMLPAFDTLRNSESPAMLFFHVEGDPRQQIVQTVSIWCNHEDVSEWKAIAAASLIRPDRDSGEQSDAPESASWGVSTMEDQPRGPGDR